MESIHVSTQRRVPGSEIAPRLTRLWRCFDAGSARRNDLRLIQGALSLLEEYDAPSRDVDLYGGLLACVRSGGFLLEEEKVFVVNYAILVLCELQPALSAYLRDCSSLLDVWPERSGVRKDRATGAERLEWFWWFTRRYEALGNLFLSRKGHDREYYGMELVDMLAVEKCRLRETDYCQVAKFIREAHIRMNGATAEPTDIQQAVRAMHKLVWKIVQGITRYS